MRYPRYLTYVDAQNLVVVPRQLLGIELARTSVLAVIKHSRREARVSVGSLVVQDLWTENAQFSNIFEPVLGAPASGTPTPLASASVASLSSMSTASLSSMSTSSLSGKKNPHAPPRPPFIHVHYVREIQAFPVINVAVEPLQLAFPPYLVKQLVLFAEAASSRKAPSTATTTTTTTGASSSSTSSTKSGVASSTPSPNSGNDTTQRPPDVRLSVRLANPRFILCKNWSDPKTQIAVIDMSSVQITNLSSTMLFLPPGLLKAYSIAVSDFSLSWARLNEFRLDPQLFTVIHPFSLDLLFRASDSGVPVMDDDSDDSDDDHQDHHSSNDAAGGASRPRDSFVLLDCQVDEIVVSHERERLHGILNIFVNVADHIAKGQGTSSSPLAQPLYDTPKIPLFCHWVSPSCSHDHGSSHEDMPLETGDSLSSTSSFRPPPKKPAVGRKFIQFNIAARLVSMTLNAFKNGSELMPLAHVSLQQLNVGINIYSQPKKQKAVIMVDGTVQTLQVVEAVTGKGHVIVTSKPLEAIPVSPSPHAPSPHVFRPMWPTNSSVGASYATPSTPKAPGAAANMYASTPLMSSNAVTPSVNNYSTTTSSSYYHSPAVSTSLASSRAPMQSMFAFPPDFPLLPHSPSVMLLRQQVAASMSVSPAPQLPLEHVADLSFLDQIATIDVPTPGTLLRPQPPASSQVSSGNDVLSFRLVEMLASGGQLAVPIVKARAGVRSLHVNFVPEAFEAIGEAMKSDHILGVSGGTARRLKSLSTAQLRWQYCFFKVTAARKKQILAQAKRAPGVGALRFDSLAEWRDFCRRHPQPSHWLRWRDLSYYLQSVLSKLQVSLSNVVVSIPGAPPSTATATATTSSSTAVPISNEYSTIDIVLPKAAIRSINQDGLAMGTLLLDLKVNHAQVYLNRYASTAIIPASPNVRRFSTSSNDEQYSFYLAHDHPHHLSDSHHAAMASNAVCIERHRFLVMKELVGQLTSRLNPTPRSPLLKTSQLWLGTLRIDFSLQHVVALMQLGKSLAPKPKPKPERTPVEPTDAQSSSSNTTNNARSTVDSTRPIRATTLMITTFRTSILDSPSNQAALVISFDKLGLEALGYRSSRAMVQVQIQALRFIDKAIASSCVLAPVAGLSRSRATATASGGLQRSSLVASLLGTPVPSASMSSSSSSTPASLSSTLSFDDGEPTMAITLDLSATSKNISCTVNSYLCILHHQLVSTILRLVTHFKSLLPPPSKAPKAKRVVSATPIKKKSSHGAPPPSVSLRVGLNNLTLAIPTTGETNNKATPITLVTIEQFAVDGTVAPLGTGSSSVGITSRVNVAHDTVHLSDPFAGTCKSILDPTQLSLSLEILPPPATDSTAQSSIKIRGSLDPVRFCLTPDAVGIAKRTVDSLRTLIATHRTSAAPPPPPASPSIHSTIHHDEPNDSLFDDEEDHATFEQQPIADQETQQSPLGKLAAKGIQSIHVELKLEEAALLVAASQHDEPILRSRLRGALLALELDCQTEQYDLRAAVSSMTTSAKLQGGEHSCIAIARPPLSGSRFDDDEVEDLATTHCLVLSVAPSTRSRTDSLSAVAVRIEAGDMELDTAMLLESTASVVGLFLPSLRNSPTVSDTSLPSVLVRPPAPPPAAVAEPASTTEEARQVAIELLVTARLLALHHSLEPLADSESLRIEARQGTVSLQLLVARSAAAVRVPSVCGQWSLPAFGVYHVPRSVSLSCENDASRGDTRNPSFVRISGFAGEFGQIRSLDALLRVRLDLVDLTVPLAQVHLLQCAATQVQRHIRSLKASLKPAPTASSLATASTSTNDLPAHITPFEGRVGRTGLPPSDNEISFSDCATSRASERADGSASNVLSSFDWIGSAVPVTERWMSFRFETPRCLRRISWEQQSGSTFHRPDAMILQYYDDNTRHYIDLHSPIEANPRLNLFSYSIKDRVAAREWRILLIKHESPLHSWPRLRNITISASEPSTALMFRTSSSNSSSSDEDDEALEIDTSLPSRAPSASRPSSPLNVPFSLGVQIAIGRLQLSLASSLCQSPVEGEADRLLGIVADGSTCSVRLENQPATESVAAHRTVQSELSSNVHLVYNRLESSAVACAASIEPLTCSIRVNTLFEPRVRVAIDLAKQAQSLNVRVTRSLIHVLQQLTAVLKPDKASALTSGFELYDLARFYPFCFHNNTRFELQVVEMPANSIRAVIAPRSSACVRWCQHISSAVPATQSHQLLVRCGSSFEPFQIDPFQATSSITPVPLYHSDGGGRADESLFVGVAPGATTTASSATASDRFSVTHISISSAVVVANLLPFPIAVRCSWSNTEAELDNQQQQEEEEQQHQQNSCELQLQAGTLAPSMSTTTTALRVSARPVVSDRHAVVQQAHGAICSFPGAFITTRRSGSGANLSGGAASLSVGQPPRPHSAISVRLAGSEQSEWSVPMELRSTQPAMTLQSVVAPDGSQAFFWLVVTPASSQNPLTTVQLLPTFTLTNRFDVPLMWCVSLADSGSNSVSGRLECDDTQPFMFDPSERLELRLATPVPDELTATSAGTRPEPLWSSDIDMTSMQRVLRTSISSSIGALHQPLQQPLQIVVNIELQTRNNTRSLTLLPEFLVHNHTQQHVSIGQVYDSGVADSLPLAPAQLLPYSVYYKDRLPLLMAALPFTSLASRDFEVIDAVPLNQIGMWRSRCIAPAPSNSIPSGGTEQQRKLLQVSSLLVYVRERQLAASSAAASGTPSGGSAPATSVAMATRRALSLGNDLVVLPLYTLVNQTKFELHLTTIEQSAPGGGSVPSIALAPSSTSELSSWITDNAASLATIAPRLRVRINGEGWGWSPQSVVPRAAGDRIWTLSFHNTYTLERRDLHVRVVARGDLELKDAAGKASKQSASSGDDNDLVPLAIIVSSARAVGAIRITNYSLKPLHFCRYERLHEPHTVAACTSAVLERLYEPDQVASLSVEQERASWLVCLKHSLGSAWSEPVFVGSAGSGLVRLHGGETLSYAVSYSGDMTVVTLRRYIGHLATLPSGEAMLPPALPSDPNVAASMAAATSTSGTESALSVHVIAEEHTPAARSRIPEIDINVPKLSVLVYHTANTSGDELLCLRLQDVRLSVSPERGGGVYISQHIGKVTVTTALEHATEPTLLSIGGTAAYAGQAPLAALDAAITLPVPWNRHVRKLNLTLAPIVIRLDGGTLHSLGSTLPSLFGRSTAAAQATAPGPLATAAATAVVTMQRAPRVRDRRVQAAGLSHFKSAQQLLALSSPAAQMVYVDNMVLAGISASFTMLQPKRAIKIALPNVSDMRIDLSPIMSREAQAPQSLASIRKQLVQQYKRDVMWQSLRILGAVELFGNPTRFLSVLSSTFSTLVSRSSSALSAGDAFGVGRSLMFAVASITDEALHSASSASASLAQMLEPQQTPADTQEPSSSVPKREASPAPSRSSSGGGSIASASAIVSSGGFFGGLFSSAASPKSSFFSWTLQPVKATLDLQTQALETMRSWISTNAAPSAADTAARDDDNAQRNGSSSSSNTESWVRRYSDAEPQVPSTVVPAVPEDVLLQLHLGERCEFFTLAVEVRSHVCSVDSWVLLTNRALLLLCITPIATDRNISRISLFDMTAVETNEDEPTVVRLWYYPQRASSSSPSLSNASVLSPRLPADTTKREVVLRCPDRAVSGALVTMLAAKYEYFVGRPLLRSHKAQEPLARLLLQL